MSLAASVTNSVSYIQLSLFRPLIDAFRTFRRRVRANQARRLNASSSPRGSKAKYWPPAPGKLSQKTLRHVLSTSERRLVVGSWRKIGDKEEFCRRVYFHVFLIRPNIRLFFPFAHVSLDHLKENPDFQRQASVFARFFEDAVDFISVDDARGFRNLCWKAGERHKYQQLVDEFQIEWLRIFKPAFIACLQPYCRAHTGTLSSWGKILNDVIETMTLAFENAIYGCNLPEEDHEEYHPVPTP